MYRFICAAILFITSFLSGDARYQLVEDECTLKILTPTFANRKTAKIRLANGLEAFLVSDPETHQSCAALAVDVGSWNDPETYPGMAHFLEHMLFMGTNAYPKEAEYKQFISDHGGSWNAYTATTKTVYGFSINNEFLAEGLDRFSHFFIDPLFLQNCVERELHAVDQEHGKNLEHDGWRTYMILKETGNPSHPHAKFSTGSKATLAGIPQEALQTWYKNNYSAKRMHLVVISPLKIEEIIQLVVDKFALVENRYLTDTTYPFDLLSEQQRGRWLYIQPVKDIKSLSLIWQMPRDIALDRDAHSLSLISYVLSNGAENGLCEELKREKLIESLSVSTDRFSAESVLLNIDFSLTEKGIKEIETIVDRTFQTLNRLKETGVPRYIFDEQQKLSLMRYQYQSRQDAFTAALEIAGEMSLEKLETYPQKLVLPSHYDADQALQVLNTMTPQNCIYVVTADPKLTGIEPTCREKWMDAAYCFKDIPAGKLIAWATATPHPHIDLPAPNPYFPESLALAPPQQPEQKSPFEIVNDDLGHVYFLQDQEYHVPETAAIFTIKTPDINGSASSSVLAVLYLYALEDQLSSTSFFAFRAGLSSHFSLDVDTYKIFLTGYSEKFPLFAKTIFETFHQVSPTAQQFEIYKQSLLSHYDNMSKDLPLKQSRLLLSHIIMNNHPTPQACYEALESITYEQFLSFAHTALEKAYTEAMIYGNLSKAEAIQIWNDYKTAIHPAPFPKNEHYKTAVLIPSDNKGPFMVVQSTQRQGNSALLLLHEGPFSMEKRAIQQILSAALQDDFFDTLRSKQQTGYIASSWDLEVEHQLFQLFGVQSITHEPKELLARFELFLEEFSREIQDKITPERFETLRSTLIKELKRPPANLPQKAEQLNILAFKEEGDFEWFQKRINGVESLSYATFLTHAKSYLSRQNHRRIAVLMEGILPEMNQFKYETISQEKVKGIGSYISAR